MVRAVLSRDEVEVLARPCRSFGARGQRGWTGIGDPADDVDGRLIPRASEGGHADLPRATPTSELWSNALGVSTGARRSSEDLGYGDRRIHRISTRIRHRADAVPIRGTCPRPFPRPRSKAVSLVQLARDIRSCLWRAAGLVALIALATGGVTGGWHCSADLPALRVAHLMEAVCPRVRWMSSGARPGEVILNPRLAARGGHLC